MSFIRFILFFILFMIIARIIMSVIKAFSSRGDTESKHKMEKTADKKFDIKKEDIIEADFEEIKESKADKSKK